MSLIITLSQESTKDSPVRFEVEAAGGAVLVTLPPAPDKYGCSWQTLLTEEARALAAALIHYAEEAEAGR